MAESSSADRQLTLPKVGELRRQTEAVAELLQSRLSSHLETLRSVFAPRRLLGKHVRGSASRDEVPGADRALAELRQRYKETVGPPFTLKPDLESALARIENRPELHPWEYDHQTAAGGESRRICITSPVRWVLSYGSGYSFSRLREVMAGRAEKRVDDVRQFVVNALVMKAMLDRYPNLVQLLTDLRLEVSIETADGLGKLPLVVLSSHLASFLPPDDLILTATDFSGVNEFIELVDRDAVEHLRDPLREEIEGIFG